jgi:hypothetical protein
LLRPQVEVLEAYENLDNTNMIAFFMALASCVLCWDSYEFGQYNLIKPNSLLVAVDDLRLQLTCYGNEQALCSDPDRRIASWIENDAINIRFQQFILCSRNQQVQYC